LVGIELGVAVVEVEEGGDGASLAESWASSKGEARRVGWVVE
jgi:hypothetical protein